MTGEKIKAALATYRDLLDRANVATERYGLDSTLPENDDTLSHVRWMCDGVEIFVDAGRMDKAFRWLGFIQGVLWSEGIYTIEELKEHNRPEVEA